MKSIEERLSKQIDKLKDTFEGENSVKNFEDTKEQFDKLVEKGFIKKRGNNLLSATDAHIKKRVLFNTKL